MSWVAVVVISTSAAAEPPARLVADETSAPVLVEIGGWQFFARRAVVDGTVIRLDGAYATRVGEERWVLVADRVQLAIGLGPALGIDWMHARGNVRLAGADDRFVIAGQAVSVAPSQALAFVGARTPPSLFHKAWRLLARRIEVDLTSRRVSLEDVTSKTGVADSPAETD